MKNITTQDITILSMGSTSEVVTIQNKENMVILLTVFTSEDVTTQDLEDILLVGFTYEDVSFQNMKGIVTLVIGSTSENVNIKDTVILLMGSTS